MHWSHGMQEVGFDIVNVGIMILLCHWVVAGTTPYKEGGMFGITVDVVDLTLRGLHV